MSIHCTWTLVGDWQRGGLPSHSLLRDMWKIQRSSDGPVWAQPWTALHCQQQRILPQDNFTNCHSGIPKKCSLVLHNVKGAKKTAKPYLFEKPLRYSILQGAKKTNRGLIPSDIFLDIPNWLNAAPWPDRAHPFCQPYLPRHQAWKLLDWPIRNVSLPHPHGRFWIGKTLHRHWDGKAYPLCRCDHWQNKTTCNALQVIFAK